MSIENRNHRFKNMIFKKVFCKQILLKGFVIDYLKYEKPKVFALYCGY